MARPSVRPWRVSTQSGESYQRGRGAATDERADWLEEAGHDRESFVLRHLAARLGMDLTAYKRPQLWRRLSGFARTHGVTSVSELLAFLDREPTMADALRHHLTIHVTSFFRDPAYWRELRTVLTQAPRRARWQVWSAAASTGAEPLSLAWLFSELGMEAEILATDVDEAVLERARAGRWREEELEGIPEEARQGLFERVPGEGLRVRQTWAARIRYRRLDLLADPYPAHRFDLIACRNVLIYFREEDRLRVIRRLGERLEPGGLLFLGATEVLLIPGEFGLATVSPSLYRKDV